MTIEEQAIALRNKLKTPSEIESESSEYSISYSKVFPDIEDLDELAKVKDKAVSLHIRALIKRGDEVILSKPIITIPLHQLTKIPVSRKQVVQLYATEYYDPNLHGMNMHLKPRYFEEMKPILQYAIFQNQISAKTLDKRREKFEHKDGCMIYNSAQPIHELCEWIGEVEELGIAELRADEAQDIQQAVARLESILANMGYASKSFNVEKYQDDEIAESVDSKCNINNRRIRKDASKSKEEKQAELDQDRAARFTNCDEANLDALPTSATTNTVSNSRIAYEIACGRTVKEGRKK
ncbi:hypothetical protein [Vibrio crassostreae]|uniref:hypothetical protein n=1 Tax=Vibrio crassostreae TaxID=246167 RepID=UPI000F460766|nr:hypothetical protein [Vibrio crassostreae]ROQ79723.1 hypothetical protein EDB72_2415 [Vibrio crassostreae]